MVDIEEMPDVGMLEAEEAHCEAAVDDGIAQLAAGHHPIAVSVALEEQLRGQHSNAL